MLVVTPHASFAEADISAVLESYPQLTTEPFGKGVFAHTRRPGGRTRSEGFSLQELARVPGVAGTQLSYMWAELEPSPGRYRWDLLDKDLHPWAEAGKKCWIEISTCDQRAVGGRASLGTPQWVFDAGVPRVQARSTAAYPVFWNDKYLELWGRFIDAFAERYDGDPRIEFLSTGGYSSGHEPNLTSRDNAVLLDQWKAAGFDGFTTTGVYFRGAVVPVIDQFDAAFDRTPLAQTIHVKSAFDVVMNEYAAKKGFVLISNGLSVKVATVRGREEWARRKQQHKTKVGYAEWGPTGRRLRRERSVASAMSVYRGVLGDADAPRFQPLSGLSYLPLSYQIASSETYEEWLAAVQWAAEHLAD